VHRLLCEPQTFLALSQGLFCSLALSNVMDRATKLDDVAGAIAPRFTLGDEPSSCAVKANHLKIEFVGRSSAQRFFHGAPQTVPAFGGVEF